MATKVTIKFETVPDKILEGAVAGAKPAKPGQWILGEGYLVGNLGHDILTEMAELFAEKGYHFKNPTGDSGQETYTFVKPTDDPSSN